MKTVLLVIATLSAALMVGCTGDNSKKNGAAAGDVKTAEYPNVAGQVFGRWKGLNTDQDGNTITTYISKNSIALVKSCGASVQVSANVSENTIEFLEEKDGSNGNCQLPVGKGSVQFFIENKGNLERLNVETQNGTLAFERIP